MFVTIEEIKAIIKEKILIERLELEDVTPEDIADDAPLFGEGLGLDSVEALDVVAGLQAEFGIKLQGASPESLRQDFYSVSTLASFVHRTLNREVVAQQ